MQQLDNLRLCGLDHTYEQEQFIKGNANRLHRCGTHIHTSIQKSPIGLDIVLAGATKNAGSIIASVETGAPRNLSNKRIRHHTVRKELLILAKDLIKIQNASNKVPNLNSNQKEKLSELQNQAELMVKMAMSTYQSPSGIKISLKSYQKENLMLWGLSFSQNSDTWLPKEVLGIIMSKRYEAKIVEDTVKKLTEEVLTAQV